MRLLFTVFAIIISPEEENSKGKYGNSRRQISR